MRKLITICGIFALLGGLVFCACTVEEQEEDAEAVYRAHLDRIKRGYETGDIDLYMDAYADDAVAMPPDGPVVIGSEQIRAMSQPFFDPSVSVKVAIDLQEAVISGDWLFARCSSTHSITSKEKGTTTTLYSKILEILKRQADDSWKCHTVCWNSEKPPTVTSEEADFE